MIRITFTENIQRHVTCPIAHVEGRTVREALEAVFLQNEKARGYVLDDRGALRKHMVIFVNGEPIRDRVRLSDSISRGAEIYVMQALSGG